jgi:hypothetical protein
LRNFNSLLQMIIGKISRTTSQSTIGFQRSKELMTKLPGAMKRSLGCTLLCVLFLGMSAMLTLTGCGGSTPQQSGLPTPPTPGLVNSYVGGQGNSPLQQSPWSVTIDHTKSMYSYTNPNSANPVPTTGSFSVLTGGFLVLLNQSGYQSGLALEIPGEAIILRPGDSTTAPVFAVQQASCFAIGGNVKFLFAFSPGLSNGGQAFFGRIYASTNSDGSSWQFNNQTQYQAPNGNVPTDADSPGYPSGFAGSCSVSNGSAVVNSSPAAYFNGGPTPPPTLPTQYVISPSGFFFENQSYENVISAGIGGWTIPNISAWGVSEPAQPLIVGNIGAATYLGFLFETTNSNSTYRTQVVGFGNAPVAGTVMNGGTFPNDDPTQTANANMSVTFGTQDPLNNGSYYLAKLTTPDDGTNFTDSCLTYGLSKSGTPTCTNDAVATVGYLNGQYAIIISATDTSGNQETLVLLQQ